jgi:hypothetical protein
MSDEGTRTSGLKWIPSVFHPERRIAGPTIAAVRAILGGRRSGATVQMVAGPGAAPLVVRLEDVPDLGEVGGIAKLQTDGGEALGIARVGRTSFVGYKLEDEVLREIEVELEESTGELRIPRVEAYPAP